MSTRAIVVFPDLGTSGGPQSGPTRDPSARLEEAIGLTRAIGLEVVHAEVVRVSRPKPATLLVIDAAISPVQQRNLENAIHCKVIDRTGLILEIFGARARTKEGRLQVELAALTYQRSRLVRSWTHLERQRGGFGFLGGPGESQLEIDRRLITERINRLKSDLEQVRKTRALHRSARQKVPFPVVALVGYTNAGKSTLFNRLTDANVRSEDLLFATLDPTMRRLALPSGLEAILSDTVGFISDLPTELVAAFRATLEEVVSANLILHVRDINHPDSQAQCDDVQRVLANLEIDGTEGPPVIEVWNKLDLVDGERRKFLQGLLARREDAAACSAITGEGCDDLLQLIDGELSSEFHRVVLSVPLTDGAAIAWLYDKGRVVGRHDDDCAAHMEVILDPADLDRFMEQHQEVLFGTPDQVQPDRGRRA